MKKAGYELRIFEWDDVCKYFDDLVEMQKDSIYGFHYPDKEPNLDYIVSKLRELEEHLDKGHTYFIGIINEGELCGYIWAYENTFLGKKRMNIHSLYVRKQYRKIGLGQMLLGEIKKIATDSECESIATHYASFNEAAGAFYVKNGFSTTRIEVVCKLRT